MPAPAATATIAANAADAIVAVASNVGADTTVGTYATFYCSAYALYCEVILVRESNNGMGESA